MPKPEIDPITISLKIPKDLLADIDEYANYQHVNRSEAVRDLLKKALSAVKEEPDDHD